MQDNRPSLPPSMSSTKRKWLRPRVAMKTHVNDVPGFKWCPRCNDRLPVEKFGVQAKRPDGLSGECRDCRAERTRVRRRANPEQHRVDGRARYKQNAIAFKAKVAVARAVERGQLEKPQEGTPCACGRVEPLVAHHHRGLARKHWLDVVWRCRSCAGAYPTLKDKPPRWSQGGAHAEVA